MTPITRTALVALATLALAAPATADAWRGTYQVQGVKGEDMLKMRAGPGTGYKIIVGLPNGTRVHVQSCERSGSTRWCAVTLDAARGLRGYVSESYLREE